MWALHVHVLTFGVGWIHSCDGCSRIQHAKEEQRPLRRVVAVHRDDVAFPDAHLGEPAADAACRVQDAGVCELLPGYSINLHDQVHRR